jgi:hypothetical protein
MVPMHKNHGSRDYIEWNSDAPVPARDDERGGESSAIEGLFDAEIRRRIGEVIARAADGEKIPTTGRGPKRH